MSAMSVEGASLVPDMPMPIAMKSPMPCAVVEDALWPSPAVAVLKPGESEGRED
jgi:hypothetical protein